MKQAVAPEEDEPRSSPCDLQNVMDNASENLTLHAEQQVRSTVQSTIQDALANGCSADKGDASSPRTMRFSSCSLMDNDEESDDGKQTGENNGLDMLPGESMVASVIRKLQTPPRKSPKKDNKPMKTPGGVVIPTPFQCASAKSLFPNTSLDRVFCRASDHKSPRKTRLGDTTEQGKNLSTTFSDSLGSYNSSGSSSWTYPVDASSKTPMEDDDITEPMEMVRMVSSLEDLATVKEASSSKETASYGPAYEAGSFGAGSTNNKQKHVEASQDDDDDAFLPDDFKATLNQTATSMTASSTQSSPRFTRQDLEKRVAEAVARVKDEIREQVHKEGEERLEAAMAEYSTQGELLLEEHSRQRQKEYDEELNALREKYEQKLSEQKDKAAMARNLSKGRKMDLEAKEAELAKEKEELEKFKREKEQQYERLRSELESVTSRVDASKVVELEKELTDVKAQLKAAQEQSLNDSQSSVKVLQSELDKVRKELKMAQSNLADSKTLGSKKVKSLEDELAKVNDVLAAKEKELALNSKQQSTPNRRASTGTTASKTPTRLQKPSPSKGKIGSGLREGVVEIHEREKESLRQQILLLEEQAAKSSEEHTHALAELRRASEAEIIAVRKQLEEKLQVHMERERELKETLSNVASVEKEELLEQIDRLQNEKKADRTGGLREVQKKEDLLHRIAALEKKEKSLVEEHERSLSEVRISSEDQISKLRLEMEAQKEERIEKENELRRALSETSTFEKEDLMLQVEKLQAELESERSSAVLVKMRVTTVEKEAEAVLEAEKEERRQAETSFKDEISRLKGDLDALREKETQLEACIAERDALKTELEAALLDLKTMKETLEAQLEDLKKNHSSDVEALKRESEETLEKQRAEGESKTSTMKAEYEKRIAELEKASEDSIAGLRKELVEKEIQLKQEYDSKTVQSTADIEALKEEIVGLKKASEESRAQYEQRIKALADDHHKELDDLLAQLDLVEAEHKEKLSKNDQALVEKNAIVEALGRQLADAQTKANSCQEEQEKALEQIETFRAKSEETQKALDVCKDELDKTKAAHTQFVEAAEEEKEKACEDAREEMIERAEAQFQQANDVYIKLKKQYDITKTKVEKLEKELKISKGEVDTVSREMEDRAVNLKAEIAQLKVEKAEVEAGAAVQQKEYRREMEGLLRAAQDFEKKCREAEEKREFVEKTLATVVTEKSKLKSENEELNKLCEELMAHVESGQQHEC